MIIVLIDLMRAPLLFIGPIICRLCVSLVIKDALSTKMSEVVNWQATRKLIKGDLFEDKKVICFS